MNPNYLDFEQPIADLEAKIQELRNASTGPAVNVEAEVNALRNKLRVRTAQIFRDLSPWQVSQMARHPQRPYTLDYIRIMCDEFQELAGDRAYADDKAIVGGLGTPTHSAVVEYLNNEEVPDLFVSSGAQLWGNDPEARPMTFGWQRAFAPFCGTKA